MSEGDINVVMKISNSTVWSNEILVFVCVGSSWTTQNSVVCVF